jgi:hypothetical protein
LSNRVNLEVGGGRRALLVPWFCPLLVTAKGLMAGLVHEVGALGIRHSMCEDSWDGRVSPA